MCQGGDEDFLSDPVGIGAVFQELSLIADLTVAENLFFGDEHLTPLGTISRRHLAERAEKLFAHLGLEAIRPDAPAGTLSIGERQAWLTRT